jgi:hypothetical protein
MKNDEEPVGYGKPPNRTKFRPGVSGNPKGRPKRSPSALADIIRDTMNTPLQIREHGRVKSLTRKELAVRLLIDRATKGDLMSADQVLKVRAQAKRHGEMGIEALQILNWLPDPGQTADQKNQDFERGKHVVPRK